MLWVLAIRGALVSVTWEKREGRYTWDRIEMGGTGLLRAAGGAASRRRAPSAPARAASIQHVRQQGGAERAIGHAVARDLGARDAGLEQICRFPGTLGRLRPPRARPACRPTAAAGGGGRTVDTAARQASGGAGPGAGASGGIDTAERCDQTFRAPLRPTRRRTETQSSSTHRLQAGVWVVCFALFPRQVSSAPPAPPP